MNIKKISIALLSSIALVLPTFSLSAQPTKAGLGSDPDCPDEGSPAASGEMSEDCHGTPAVMEIPFYEIGFCTSDPLVDYSFSRENCSKAWSSTAPQTVDIASFNYQGLTSGSTYKVPNQTYTHAYVILSNAWGIKGKAYFNSKTYYSTSDGSFTDNEASYGKYDNTTTYMNGTEFPSTGDNCYDYANTTPYGSIKAVLTDVNLTSASDRSSCNSAQRLVGSIDLDTDLVMTDSVKNYKLTWVVRKMGLYVDWEGDAEPGSVTTGPFVPNFEFSK